MSRYIIVTFLFLSFPVAHADQGSSNRLISEAVPAWQKLKLAEEHGTFHMKAKKWATENDVSLDHWTGSSQKTLMRDGISFLVKTTAEGAVGVGYFGSNPSYLFNVSRPNDGAAYVLRSLDTEPTDKSRADLQKQLGIFYGIARSRLFASIPLEELVTDPGFQLKRIEETLADGHQCLKIYFAAKLTRNKGTFLESFILLDPDRNWSILKSEANFPNYKLVMENEYWPKTNGISWLRRCMMVSTYPVEHVQENHEYVFDQVTQDSISASAFLLSSFGMPEPNKTEVADYESKLHYWFIAGALVLFVAAYLIRRKALRKN